MVLRARGGSGRGSQRAIATAEANATPEQRCRQPNGRRPRRAPTQARPLVIGRAAVGPGQQGAAGRGGGSTPRHATRAARGEGAGEQSAALGASWLPSAHRRSLGRQPGLTRASLGRSLASKADWLATWGRAASARSAWRPGRAPRRGPASASLATWSPKYSAGSAGRPALLAPPGGFSQAARARMALRIAAVLAVAASVAVLANGQSVPGAATKAPAASAAKSNNGDLLAGLLASLGDWVKPADDFVQTATEYGKLMSGTMVRLAARVRVVAPRDASTLGARRQCCAPPAPCPARTCASHGSSARGCARPRADVPDKPEQCLLRDRGDAQAGGRVRPLRRRGNAPGKALAAAGPGSFTAAQQPAITGLSCRVCCASPCSQRVGLRPAEAAGGRNASNHFRHHHRDLVLHQAQGRHSRQVSSASRIGSAMPWGGAARGSRRSGPRCAGRTCCHGVAGLVVAVKLLSLRLPPAPAVLSPAVA